MVGDDNGYCQSGAKHAMNSVHAAREIAVTKILAVCGYWNGDRAQMEQVVRLISDLMEKPTTQSELLFLGRYDAEPPSREVYDHAAKRFSKVNYWRCNRVGYGFPDGCSQLIYGLFQYIQDQRRVNRFYLDIDALLILESDCAITRRCWVGELCAEWDRTKSMGKMIAGAIQPSGKWGHDVQEHVNAVGLYDVDILNALPCLKDGSTAVGWDYFHRNSTLPVAINSPLFKLDWQKQTISPEELFADPSVLVYHGVKDQSAVELVRKKYNL